MFSSLSKTEIIILAKFKLWHANDLNLVVSIILPFGKGLNVAQPRNLALIGWKLKREENNYAQVTSIFSFPTNNFQYSITLFCCLQKLWVWTSLKICCLVRSYTVVKIICPCPQCLNFWRALNIAWGRSWFLSWTVQWFSINFPAWAINFCN